MGEVKIKEERWERMLWEGRLMMVEVERNEVKDGRCYGKGD